MTPWVGFREARVPFEAGLFREGEDGIVADMEIKNVLARQPVSAQRLRYDVI